MKYGHNDFKSTASFLGMDTGWDSTAIIFNRNRIVFMYGNENILAMTGEGLVDGIVHHLIYEVMQSLHTNIANIHGRALTHGFKSFQNLNRIGTIGWHYCRSRSSY